MAGMAAAMTSARLGRRTVIFTGDVPGGQLMSIEKVEGLPGHPDGIPGYDLCPIMQDQAGAAGAEFMMCNLDGLASVDGKWRLTTAEGEILAGAVILATGSSLKKLGVPGEERLTGSGVSHCATCDAPLMRGRIVAVVGGGDSAMQEALTIAEFSSKVIILQRDAGLTGQAWYRDRIAAHPKIEVRCGVIVREILGDAEVSGVRVQAAAGGETSDIEVAAVFANVGLTPNTAFLKDVVALNAEGLIPTDADTRTALPGLCSAGNIRAQSSFRAAGAAGDGAAAAVAADRYLADSRWSGGNTSRSGEILLAAASR
jgi:thioredoxin reductase (NADPH)